MVGHFARCGHRLGLHLVRHRGVSALVRDHRWGNDGGALAKPQSKGGGLVGGARGGTETPGFPKCGIAFFSVFGICMLSTRSPAAGLGPG